MKARNPWVMPLAAALLSVLLPVTLLSLIYLTAPDSPLVAGPSLPSFIELSLPGAMPDFPNGPVSPLFVGVVGLSVLFAAVLGASAVVLLAVWFTKARISSVAATAAGPIVIWVLVFVIPMSHRVIRDYNAGFTRTDLLSYTAVLWTWVLAAAVAHVVMSWRGRSRWKSSPT